MHAWRSNRSVPGVRAAQLLLRCAALLVLTAALQLATPSRDAHAVSVDFGSTLAEASSGFTCNDRPATAPNGQFFTLPSGVPTCTWFLSGLFGISGSPVTAYAPGTGTIRTVTVRSGNNPAPLRVSILRQITPVLPNGQLDTNKSACCFGQVESDVFQPTPNTTTTVTVNLPVEQVKDTANAQAWSDIIGITAVGPGTIPLFFNGNTNGISPGNPFSGFLHPAIAPQQIRTDMSGYPGMVVLARFNFCDGAVARLRSDGLGRAGRAATGGCASTTPPPAGTGGTGNAGAALRGTVPAARANVRGNRASVGVRCAGQGQCSSRVRLVTRGRAPKLLGVSARTTVAGGTSQTLNVALNTRGRALLKAGRSVKVTARVDSAGAKKYERVLTLRPQASATFSGAKLTVRGSRANVTMRCAAGPACRGTLRVVRASAPRTLLATGAFAKTASGKRRAVRLTLTKAGRAELAKRGSSVRVRVTTKLAGGYSGTRIVTLQRAS